MKDIDRRKFHIYKYKCRKRQVDTYAQIRWKQNEES